MSNSQSSTAPRNEAGIEGSNYDIIRRRLEDQALELRKRADALNDARAAKFGGTEMSVVGQERVRTEHNCVPRDIVSIGQKLLFGYNVKMGLKTKTEVADVFTLHHFSREKDPDSAATFQLSPLPEETSDNFLSDPKFVQNFDELYNYYKDTRLAQLLRVEGRLLAIFQVGSTLGDRRVLRWGLDANDDIQYLDNAGDRDLKLPDSHDFDWRALGREHHVLGKNPHISIIDEVFVETVGGDLTIKVEDNTADGQGIYREPVEDKHQSLGDAECYWAKVGNLILIKILPYREDKWRYFVFNTLTKEVERLDAIGQSCIQLPEEQGVVFPGGFVLSNGRARRFDGEIEGMRIHQVIRSANGEDVLYVFYRPQDGNYLLLAYNVIRKDVQNPINCQGYSLFEDGTMIVFRFQGDEPTRVHPMQIWQTPFVGDEFAASQPQDDSLLSNIGNPELVRGISDAYSLAGMVDELAASMPVYEALIASAQRLIDGYFWLSDAQVGDLASVAREMVSTAGLVIDEFQKVTVLQEKARDAIVEVESAQRELFTDVRYQDWRRIERFVDGLGRLRKQRGRLITLKDTRYIDVARLDELEVEVTKQYDQLSKAAADFLLDEEALKTYRDGLTKLESDLETLADTKRGRELEEQLNEINAGLNLLTEVVSTLQVDDPTQRTKILENIGEVLGRQNRDRARLQRRLKELAESEGRAEFGVQIQLFSQSIASALGICNEPEDCDEHLTRLMAQLEELEGRFSSFDGFLTQLAEKRDELYEVFESRKRALVEARRRRADNMAASADRILKGVVRRASSLKSVEDLNGYFAADPMVMKVRDLAQNLREFNEGVRADDIESRLRSARDKAARQLRDKIDLFAGGDDIIQFGRHRFSVHTQKTELTLVPHADAMALHISGTEFLEPLEDPEFEKTRPFWSQALISETDEVYRGEYLAASILFAAEQHEHDLDMGVIEKMRVEGRMENPDDPAKLKSLARDFINRNFNDGYERGVHDEDAARILDAFLGLYASAGLLRFTPEGRALATLFWAYSTSSHIDKETQESRDLIRSRDHWRTRALSLGRLRESLGHAEPIQRLGEDLAEAIEPFARQFGDFAGRTKLIAEAGEYLAEELVDQTPRFIESSEAAALRDKFLGFLDQKHARLDFDADLAALGDNVSASWRLAMAWIAGFARTHVKEDVEHLLAEVAALILCDKKLERQSAETRTSVEITDLLGDHPRIQKGKLLLRLDEFLTRLRRYFAVQVPGYRAYRQASRDILARERLRLRIDDLEPQVFGGFVRNQLIDKVYLPLIGDNLAKQMGTVGDDSGSARSGLLLLISPPGYGKTTLMEYIADRLGVIFMKINAPALGHNVTSLDPAEAPNLTARQEVEKINLALEMGNNVILYLDDIQHTHSEFLQKFISLCDATRRIEGVWKGKPKTYDLRGKRFAVIMAGNPYTESGARFRIPDMLANRADTYNLGDILSGKRDVFEMSYIENALTSNPVTAPLTRRERGDIARFLKLADGMQIPLSEFDHAYSSVEAGEIVNVLKKMNQIRDVVLKVNQQYIESAGKEDNYRTEPPFQLQGSYRNMNRMAAKIASAMNDAEVQALIDNHYDQESQTLTSGSEQNLLKLAELRGTMTEGERARWEEIKGEYRRRNQQGDEDPIGRVASQLGDIREVLELATRSAKKGAPKIPKPRTNAPDTSGQPAE